MGTPPLCPSIRCLQILLHSLAPNFCLSGQLPSLVHTPLHHAPALSTTTTLSPHPADLHLVTDGLTSLLLSMSDNHGFALHVAIGVYRDARNLREADEVLMGVRESCGRTRGGRAQKGGRWQRLD